MDKSEEECRQEGRGEAEQATEEEREGMNLMSDVLEIQTDAGGDGMVEDTETQFCCTSSCFYSLFTQSVPLCQI